MSNKTLYDSVTITTSDLIPTIDLALRSDTSLLVLGPPGSGKTSIITDTFCNNEQYDHFLCLSVCNIDAVDLKIPVPCRDIKVKRYNPRTKDVYEDEIKGPVSSFAIGDIFPRSGRTFVFVDDITNSDPVIQATLYSLILEKRIGEYRLPKDSYTCAAGNRVFDNTGSTQLNTALRDRMLVVNCEPNLDYFKDICVKFNFHPSIYSFCSEGLKIRSKDHEHTNPIAYLEPDHPSAGASMRSWERLSNLLKAEIPDHLLEKICCGTIGTIGMPFAAWYTTDYLQNIKVEDIINDPLGCDIPERPDLITALMDTLLFKLNKHNVDPIAKFVINRLSGANGAMFAMNAQVNKGKIIRVNMSKNIHNEYINKFNQLMAR